MRADGRLVDTFVGQRCQGNTACTPICPVQAKYSALKTLAQARRQPGTMMLVTQAVASEVRVDPESGAVRAIAYKHYDDPSSPNHTEHVARGRAYVLAAHAVENAKLMLASSLGGDLVGRHLMDHPALYAWGLAAEPIGAFRGPLSTSGIEDTRGGAFRARHAAFRFDIGNDGWRATAGAPDTDVLDAVLKRKLTGAPLREHLAATLPRQVRVSRWRSSSCPRPRIASAIDPRWRDPLGNPRPVISYRVDEYTRAGMAAASGVAAAVFARAGIEDHTAPRRRRTSHRVVRGEELPLPRHGPFRRHAPHGRKPGDLRRRRRPARVGPPQPVSSSAPAACRRWARPTRRSRSPR